MLEAVFSTPFLGQILFRGGKAAASVFFLFLLAGPSEAYPGNTKSTTPLLAEFQKLEAEATPDGLWVHSTEGAPEAFRVLAVQLYRRDNIFHDAGTILDPPAATNLTPSGQVHTASGTVSFIRHGLVEEYRADTNGIRQDFLVTQRPGGSGSLRLTLAIDGAGACLMPFGAKLTLHGSGREIAYSRLQVTDAAGRSLPAEFECSTPDQLQIIVNDTDAAYPIRIDPTFSDADWLSLNQGMPGADRQVLTIIADSAGNLYAGGSFSFIGNTPANRVAKWNGTSWSALGQGIEGSYSVVPGICVKALALVGTDLYAAGRFETAGGLTAHNIAKWNGSVWSTVGPGIPSGQSGGVNALAVIGTDLYAGGDFFGIKKWNGSAWTSLLPDTGLSDAAINALAVIGTDLYAGGEFATLGGVTVNQIAKWNGSVWSPLGTGMSGNPIPWVNALAVRGSELYAAGSFQSAGGVANTGGIAKWNGTAWSALGSGIPYPDRVYTLAVSGSNIYAGGDFSTAGGVSASSIARWNGSSWSALNTGMGGVTSPIVSALAVSGTNLYAGGDFETAGGKTTAKIAKWNGAAWSAFGSGMNGEVRALARIGSDLYIGGKFRMAGSLEVNSVAKWNGSTWSALGTGLNTFWGYEASVNALAVMGGQLYAGGDFDQAGATPVQSVARWNGISWVGLGQGFGGEVNAMAVVGSELYAGGSFNEYVPLGNLKNIARWNGNWMPLGTGTDWDVNALAVSGTDLYVGGRFTRAGGLEANRVAKWNGTAWSALGSGTGFDINALAVNGTDLYAGGGFSHAGGIEARGIAKWNGSVWSALGLGVEGYVHAIAFRGSDVVVGGSFGKAGGAAANQIAQWNGSAWSALGSGMRTTLGFGSAVHALSIDASSQLVAGGNFYLAGTTASPYLARATLPSGPGSGIQPSVTTQAATLITTTQATLHGSGNPNGKAANAWFEFGPSPAYGRFAGNMDLGQGTGAVSLTVSLSNLSPGTRYHFRAAAQNGEITSHGADLTFLTPSRQEIWRKTWFGTMENQGPGADDFDFDKDGLSNLMEWALGLSPILQSLLPLTYSLNQTNLEFNYYQGVDAKADGVTFAVEWNDTMDLAGPWSTSGVSETLHSSGSRFFVRALVPAGPTGRRFVRLRVTAPPRP